MKLTMKNINIQLAVLALAASYMQYVTGAGLTKILPPQVSPSSKHVLFTSNLDVNTEINQMLDVADELTKRGHICSFVALEEFESKIAKRGFEFHGIKNVLKRAGKGEKVVSVIDRMQKAPTWWSYMEAFYGVPEILSDLYEPALLKIKNVIEEKRPDVIFSSMFSDVSIDLAAHYDVPLVILYAAPLGSVFDYEDSPAAPDGFLWPSRQEHLSFWPRLRKFVRLAMVISGTMKTSIKINAIRQKYNIPPVTHPLTNWARAAVICSFPMGIQISRPLRPLTFMVGFLTTPYQSNSSEGLTEHDTEMKRWLDSKHEGVVYCALGSLAFLSQDVFNEVINGMADWVESQHNESDRGAIFAINSHAQTRLNLSATPNSVRVEGWVNQKMILNHPHTKAFITHAGLGSLGESIMSLTPMLAIPMFGDQMNNAQRMEEAQLALQIHHRTQSITSSDIGNKLRVLTSDPVFTNALARHYQINARAGGVSGAADVVEDVLLLGHLDHLIPATEIVPFPANCDLDVYAFLVLTLVVVSRCLYIVCCIISTYFFKYSLKNTGKMKSE